MTKIIQVILKPEGFILYIFGVPIFWISNTQRSVTLSILEAELVELSAAMKEVMFVLWFLRHMLFSVKFPVTVHMDNIGVIFMKSNVTTVKQT